MNKTSATGGDQIVSCNYFHDAHLYGQNVPAEFDVHEGLGCLNKKCNIQ